MTPDSQDVMGQRDLWTAPTNMATAQTTPDTTFGCYYGCFPGSSERLANIPVIDIDKADGSLHVAFYTYTGGKARMRTIRSTNGGTTWSAPAEPTPLAGNQGWPWLSVSPTGTVGLTFMHSGVNGRYNEVGGFSFNGGVSFTDGAKLSTATSFFSNDGFGGTFIGDYTGSIFVGETLHASWMDARTAPSVDMTGGLAP